MRLAPTTPFRTLALLLGGLLAGCAPSADRAAQPDAAVRPPSPPPEPAAPPAAEDSGEVPAAFLGEWNVDAADCGSARNDSRLVIEPRRIAWWESSGPVTAVTVHAADAIEVTTRLTGEGDTWDATTRFTLQDPDTLVATDASGGSLARQRCPPPPHPPGN